MIDAFVFDIGNVLLRFDFGKAVARLEPLCDLKSNGRFLAPLEAVKNEYESGRRTRADFLKEAFRLLGYRGDEAGFVSAWEEIFEVNEPMVELVEALHGRYPLYLLSNISDIHVDYILAQYPFFGRFTDAVYSYRVCCSKPDPAIYTVAAQQFGVIPERTVFIDDLPANVAAAQGVGFRAVPYDFRRHDALLGTLAEWGITSQPGGPDGTI
ncbi:MAG TPA: HAD family phosphatase [Chthoniobacteraceae bacterium]|nr:HAD family phosphatase [Chthoniobacteraceae bacterium]